MLLALGYIRLFLSLLGMRGSSSAVLQGVGSADLLDTALLGAGSAVLEGHEIAPRSPAADLLGAVAADLLDVGSAVLLATGRGVVSWRAEARTAAIAVMLLITAPTPAAKVPSAVITASTGLTEIPEGSLPPP